MAKQLIVVRHAKSDWDAGAPDFERPLNARGRANAEVAGEYLRQYEVDLALVSAATRTQETWQRMNLEFPARIVSELYHASAETMMDTVAKEAASDGDGGGVGVTAAGVAADVAPNSILVLAHNPGSAELVERLITDVPQQFDAFDVDRFPTAAIAVIDLPGDWSGLADRSAEDAGVLVDFVVPR